ncbi:MAG: dUTP diphosphatase [Clostridiales bacterium]|jgi:dUTP pyrophosphatase|nr:dUTP diphosphatase [Clostridiales bacterium]
MRLKVKKLNPHAETPYYASKHAAGLDISACLEAPMEIAPNERTVVPTGLVAAIPKGHVGLMFPRSSIALKSGITLPNSVGVIDSDYRGEIGVAVVNISDELRIIEPGMRIAQLVVVPIPDMEVELVDELDVTERGHGGFGSTGV